MIDVPLTVMQSSCDVCIFLTRKIMRVLRLTREEDSKKSVRMQISANIRCALRWGERIQTRIEAGMIAGAQRCKEKWGETKVDKR